MVLIKLVITIILLYVGCDYLAVATYGHPWHRSRNKSSATFRKHCDSAIRINQWSIAVNGNNYGIRIPVLKIKDILILDFN